MIIDYKKADNAYFFNNEIEDPPESIKTPWKLWKDKRDPLHKIEEKFDTEHMIRSYKWDLELLHSLAYDSPSPDDFILKNSKLKLLNYNPKNYELYSIKDTPYLENINFGEEDDLTRYAKIELGGDTEDTDNEVNKEEKEEVLESFKNDKTRLKDMSKEKISKEDYLRAMYHLLEDNNKKEIKSVEIAKFMKVSKPSVSEMLKKLKKEDMINFKKYGEVKLTRKGIKSAIDITYKHRIIELFLKEVIKVKNSAIHNEAHKLEHAFSGNSIKKLEALLKKPKLCPHGKPIPKK